MSMRLTRPPAATDGPKHVIAEYKHRAQTVLCECGWKGSTATDGSRPSPWSAHVAENRPKRT